MPTLAPVTVIDPAIANLIDRIRDWQHETIELSQEVLKLQDKFPNLFQLVEAAVRPEDRQLVGIILRRLDRVARGKGLPQLVIPKTPGQEAIDRLPVPLQLTLLSSKTVAVTIYEDGLPVSRPVPIDDLTQAECRQVFSGKTLRNEREQIEWLKAQQLKLELAASGRQAGLGYVISGKKVTFNRGVTLDRKAVGAILAQLD